MIRWIDPITASAQQEMSCEGGKTCKIFTALTQQALNDENSCENIAAL